MDEGTRLARQYYFWRSISAVLLGPTIIDQDAAGYFGHRLGRDCLINLLRQGIGPLVPMDVELQPVDQKALEWIVPTLQELDDCIQICNGPWKIEFAYPPTGDGAAWGFPYDKSSHDMSLCDSRGSLRQVDGLPVDFVVRPYFYWTDFEERPPKISTWANMQVAVDLLIPIDKTQEDSTDEEVKESAD